MERRQNIQRHRYEGGKYFEGAWVEGKQQEQGKMMHADCRKLDGEWKEREC